VHEGEGGNWKKGREYSLTYPHDLTMSPSGRRRREEGGEKKAVYRTVEHPCHKNLEISFFLLTKRSKWRREEILGKKKRGGEEGITILSTHQPTLPHKRYLRKGGGRGKKLLEKKEEGRKREPLRTLPTNHIL